MLADVLGAEIKFTTAHEGSSFGAALLGMQALDLIDSIDVAADLVRIERTVVPRPDALVTYASLFPVFSALYGALKPTFIALRALAPDLPTAGESPVRD
jgi:gluconokinase